MSIVVLAATVSGGDVGGLVIIGVLVLLSVIAMAMSGDES